MCRVEWGRAIVEAQRLSDPDRPEIPEVVDGSPDGAEQVIRNEEARAAEPQLA
jgi:hypothetical protein